MKGSISEGRRGFLRGTAGGSVFIASAGCPAMSALAISDGDKPGKTDSSVLVIIEARAKPEALSELKSDVVKRLPEARAYDGCHEVDVYFDTDDEHRFWTVGYWESIEHNKKNMAWLSVFRPAHSLHWLSIATSFIKQHLIKQHLIKHDAVEGRVFGIHHDKAKA